MAQIQSVKLTSNYNMPVIGLGTFKEKNPDILINAVKAAVKAGYRHFDCAYIYYNQKHIGQGLKEAIAESNGELKREDFFIVSKCWNTCHSKEKVLENLNNTLDSFGFDYLDLFLIHWPMGFKENAGDDPVDEQGQYLASDVHYVDTYKYMEELVALGKVKSIGVSNFNPKQLKDVLDVCTIRPVCNQFEVNPLLLNNEWVDYCQKENVVVVAYAPFGAPDRGWSKTGEPVPLENPAVLELAKKHNKSPGQIILKWLLQRNLVVIPKSVTPSRIAENIQVFDFTLSEEDVKVFSDVKEPFRFYSFVACKNHPLYPF